MEGGKNFYVDKSQVRMEMKAVEMGDDGVICEPEQLYSDCDCILQFALFSESNAYRST